MTCTEVLSCALAERTCDLPAPPPLPPVLSLFFLPPYCTLLASSELLLYHLSMSLCRLCSPSSSSPPPVPCRAVPLLIRLSGSIYQQSYMLHSLRPFALLGRSPPRSILCLLVSPACSSNDPHCLRVVGCRVVLIKPTCIIYRQSISGLQVSAWIRRVDQCRENLEAARDAGRGDDEWTQTY